MTPTDVKIINSTKDARRYWEEEFGLPEYFSSFGELTDVEIKLADLQTEQEKLNREIQSRDATYINEYKINRAIELHFLTEVGFTYLEKCILQIDTPDDLNENEIDSYEDTLFPRKH
jgi:hypothetical protein